MVLTKINKDFLLNYIIPSGPNHGKTYEQVFHDYYTINTINGCWEWNKSISNTNGYGRMYVKRKQERPHRISYILHFDSFDEDLCVCHTCDNRKCVNPDHLFLGTYKDNIHDMMKKGRKICPVGEKSGKSKLTDKIVLEIRKLYDLGNTSYAKLGKRFKISEPNIGAIITNRTWRHI